MDFFLYKGAGYNHCPGFSHVRVKRKQTRPSASVDRYTTDFAAIKEIEIPKETYPRNGSLVIMQGRRERVIQGQGT